MVSKALCWPALLPILQLFSGALLSLPLSAGEEAVAEAGLESPGLNTSCSLLQHKLHLAAELAAQDLDTGTLLEDLGGADASVPSQLLGSPAARQQEALKSRLKAMKSAAALKAYEEKLWKKEHFAACPVPRATPSSLLERPGGSSGHKPSTVTAPSAKSSNASQCGTGSIPLFSVTSGSSTCCPAESTSCAACATYDTKTKSCSECLGGAYMKEDGLCTICLDVPGWVDLEGRNCAQLRQENVPCGDVVNGGLNSKMACCQCKDGGLDIATPFNYYVKGSILGEPVEGYPWPRTSSVYSLNSDCNLASLGLHFDTQTGALSGTPTSQNNTVQETCQVTAYQSGGLNYTATLKIDIESMAFRDFADVPDVLYFAPDDTSAEYTAMFPPTCTAPQDAKVDCVPTIPWLVFSNATATIKQDTSVSSVGGISAPGSKPFSGGICRSSAKCDNQSLFATFAVVRAAPWSGFEYPPMWTSTGKSSYAVSAGETLPALTPIATASKDQAGGELSPDKWAVTCEAPGDVSFEYNEFIGIGLLGGYEIFGLGPTSGVLTISAASNLSLLLYKLAQPSFVKQQVQLDCVVYASFGYAAAAVLGSQSQITPHTAVLTQSVQIVLQDDICWVERQACSQLTCPKGYHSKSDVGYINLCSGPVCSLTNDKEVCCSLGPALNNSHDSDKAVSVPTLADCEVDPTCGLASGSGSGTYLLRVPNCFPSSACLSIQEPSDWSTGGLYCPIGNGTLHGMVYQKNGTTTQDTRYLQNFLPHLDYVPPGSMSCKLGEYAIRKWSPLDRFTAGNYTFLGPIVGCVAIEDLRTALGIIQSGEDADASDGDKGGKGSHGKADASDGAKGGKGSHASDGDKHSKGSEGKADASDGDKGGKGSRGKGDASDGDQGGNGSHGKGDNSDSDKGGKGSHASGGKGSKHKTAKLLSVDAKPSSTRSKPSSSDSPSPSIQVSVYADNCTAPSQEEQPSNAANTFMPDEIMFDDPNTQQTFDFWLHPCECFPLAWGNRDPVDAQAYQAVPEASKPDEYNRFIPTAQKLSVGALSCSPRHMLADFLLTSNGATSSTAMQELCASSCKLNANCNYFVVAAMASTVNMFCYLFSDCSQPQLQPGTTATIFWQPRENLCHIANPEGCWEVTMRRHNLYAPRAQNPELIQGFSPSVMAVAETCDLTQMMGSSTACQSWEYPAFRKPESHDWNGKVQMPSYFQSGSQLRAACWAEQYRGTYIEANYTCFGGFWKTKQKGFACNSCLQVGSSLYAVHVKQNVQELYFASRLKLHIHAGGQCLNKDQLIGETGIGDYCDDWLVETSTLGDVLVRRVRLAGTNLCLTMEEAAVPSLASTSTTSTLLAQISEQSLMEFDYGLTLSECKVEQQEQQISIDSLPQLFWKTKNMKDLQGLQAPKVGNTALDLQVCAEDDTALGGLFLSGGNVCRIAELIDIEVYDQTLPTTTTAASSTTTASSTAASTTVTTTTTVTTNTTNTTNTTTTTNICAGLTSGPLPPPGYYCPYAEPACTICGEDSLSCYDASFTNRSHNPTCYIECPEGMTSPGGLASVGYGVTCTREDLPSGPQDPFEVPYSIADVLPVNSQTASMIKVPGGDCLTYKESNEALVFETCTGGSTQLFYYGFFGTGTSAELPIAPELATQIRNVAAGRNKCMGLTLPYQTPALPNLTSGTLGFSSCTNMFDSSDGNCSWISQLSQCYGLNQNSANQTAEACEAACCADPYCHIWQYDGSCWMGQSQDCTGGSTWPAGGRKKTSGGNQLWYFGATDAAAPLGADAAVALMQPSENVFSEFSPGAQYGATCTCPNGQVYFVSDNNSDGSNCASMCIGGTIGPDIDSCSSSNHQYCDGCGGGMGVICGSPGHPADGWTCVNTNPGEDGAFWVPVRCSDTVGSMECLSADKLNCQWTSSKADCRAKVNYAIDYLFPLKTNCSDAWGSACRLLPDGCMSRIKDATSVFIPREALCVPGSTANGIQLQADSCSSTQAGTFYLLNGDFFSASSSATNAEQFSSFGWALAGWQASPMMCPPGRVMKGFQLRPSQLEFDLQCSPALGIGKAVSVTRVLNLGETKAMYCDGEALLLGVESQLSRTEGMQVQLTCAPPLGFTTLLQVSNAATFQESDLEMGIYCPKVEPLVTSGRPTYTEVLTFGHNGQRDPSVQAPLEYSEDTGLWCFESSSQVGTSCLDAHVQGTAYGQATPVDLLGLWATANASVTQYALFSGSYPFSVPVQPSFDPSGVIPPKAIKKILKGSQKLLKGVVKKLLKMPNDLETDFDPTVSGPPGTPNSEPSTVYEPYCSSLSESAPSDSPGPCALISNANGGGQVSWQDIVNAQNKQDFANTAHWFADTYMDNAKAVDTLVTKARQNLCTGADNTETMEIKGFDITGVSTGVPLSGEENVISKALPTVGTGSFKDVKADCKSDFSDQETYFNYALSAHKRLVNGIFKANNHFRYGDASMSAQRIWCDVFCAADREKKDTNAIQLSLQKSMQETEHNMAVLSKWLQVGTVVMGSLLFEQSDVFFALESLQLDKILENTEPQQASLLQMQGSLRQMADEAADASPVGETVASAALRRFDTTIASAGTLQEDQPNTTQAKLLLAAYGNLYATLKHGALGSKMQAAASSVVKAQALNQKLALTSSIMSREARRLGFYRTLLQHQERRHGLLSKRSGLAALQLEVTDAAVSTILVELDKIYWQVRATVSEFGDDEVRAHEAFVKSLGAIKDYVACNLDHRALTEEYRSAEKVHLEKRQKLQSAWRKVESQAGLLASLIADGNVFSRLATYDVEGINASTAERALGDLAKTGDCVLTSQAADRALKKLVYDTLKGGFFGQTLEQSETLFDLAGFLHNKFSRPEDMPSQEVVQEASDRVAQAHRLAMLQLDEIVMKLKASLAPSFGCHS